MLAGNMKLRNFIIVATLLVGGGIVGLYFACNGGDNGSQQANNGTPAQPQPTPPTPTTVTTTTPAQAAADPVAPSQSQSQSATMRPVNQEVMKWVGKDLGSKKLKDVTKGRPYKVNLYQDAGKSSVNRAKVNLDRDDKWDEKWTIDGPNVSRKVAPNDDESYTESSVWNGEAWVAE